MCPLNRAWGVKNHGGDHPQSLAEALWSARLGSRLASMLLKLFSERGLPGEYWAAVAQPPRHVQVTLGTSS